ncbi:hypothetical protein BKA69DRAFT_132306 [Paraphysoderma sedebokerense]|nr:hypothetical protein BKA69DRAFT_132306 [Paraphysoderma sedebokerense]
MKMLQQQQIQQQLRMQAVQQQLQQQQPHSLSHPMQPPSQNTQISQFQAPSTQSNPPTPTVAAGQPNQMNSLQHSQSQGSVTSPPSSSVFSPPAPSPRTLMVNTSNAPSTGPNSAHSQSGTPENINDTASQSAIGGGQTSPATVSSSPSAAPQQLVNQPNAHIIQQAVKELNITKPLETLTQQEKQMLIAHIQRKAMTPMQLAQHQQQQQQQQQLNLTPSPQLANRPLGVPNPIGASAMNQIHAMRQQAATNAQQAARNAMSPPPQPAQLNSVGSPQPSFQQLNDQSNKRQRNNSGGAYTSSPSPILPPAQLNANVQPGMSMQEST